MVTPFGVVFRLFGLKITPFGVTTTNFGVISTIHFFTVYIATVHMYVIIKQHTYVVHNYVLKKILI